MCEWDVLNWTPFNDVSGNHNNVPETPGVYAIRSVRRGNPRVIGRAFGKDKSGILCFGRAGEGPGLRRRLRSFCRAASGKKVSHAEGKRYRALGYNSTDRYPLDSLRIAWLSLRSSDKAKARERRWFDQYAQKFGELPPLNRKRG